MGMVSVKLDELIYYIKDGLLKTKTSKAHFDFKLKMCFT